MCLIYAVILDMKRQSDTLMLRLDKVFQNTAGLDDYPVQSTISRFLKSFRVRTAKGIAKVNNPLLMKARRDFDGWDKITLDLDSHVRTAYGHQQKHQWDIIQRNQVDQQVFIPYFALSEKPEIFFMASSAQERLIVVEV